MAFIARAVSRHSRAGAARTFSTPPLGAGSLLEGYGEHLFKGSVADSFLEKQGLPAGTMDSGDWTKDIAKADKVAAGVMDWATSNGATVYCHWFQPTGASGVRHGLTGQVLLRRYHPSVAPPACVERVRRVGILN